MFITKVMGANPSSYSINVFQDLILLIFKVDTWVSVHFQLCSGIFYHFRPIDRRIGSSRSRESVCMCVCVCVFVLHDHTPLPEQCNINANKLID